MGFNNLLAGKTKIDYKLANLMFNQGLLALP